MMKEISQTDLIVGNLKEFEIQIISFFEKIGEMSSLNSKYTTIFAYFKLYQSLTQNQIKKLTKFSLSTISTTLQTFLQTDILVKKLLPNSRTYTYQLQHEKVSFIYIAFTDITAVNENYDVEVAKLQSRLRALQKKYPQKSLFLEKRINSLRNYFEAQRRAIDKKEKYSFFEEEISKFIMDDIITDYPLEIKEIEDKVVELMIMNGVFFGTDFIKNKIIGYFLTRGKVTQELLEELTDYSRSTISRNLQYFLEKGIIKAMDRKFRKPSMYYFESASLTLINGILQSDDYIFSWKEKFEILLESISTNKELEENKKEKQFLIDRITELIKEIEEFKTGYELLVNAQDELKASLK